MTKKQLMEKYGIKSVGGGTYGEGFFDCLKGIEEKAIIKVPKHYPPPLFPMELFKTKWRSLLKIT